jgi:hypothetical protein
MSERKINYGTVIQLWAEKNNAQVDYASEYGEPGYSDPEAGIIVADWNDVPQRIQDGLERQGYELEWIDEWYISCDSSPAKAWRSEPDCHSWESRLLYCDGYVLTADDDISDWIEQCEFTSADDGRVLPSWWDDADFVSANWRLYDPTAADFESGFHPGQTDEPAKFLPAILRVHGKALIQRTEQSQFYSKFRVWVPSPEVAEDLTPIDRAIMRHLPVATYEAYAESENTDSSQMALAATRNSGRHHWTPAEWIADDDAS